MRCIVPLSSETVSFGIQFFLGAHPLPPFCNGDVLTIGAPISGEPGVIYQAFSPTFSRRDTDLKTTGFELTAFGNDGESDPTIKSILAFVDRGMIFERFGRTGQQTTVPTELSPTSGFFALDPGPNEFIREGTITSLTLVSQAPLPAAAWLMLSGLAALAGVRAWPRGRRS